MAEECRIDVNIRKPSKGYSSNLDNDLATQTRHIYNMQSMLHPNSALIILPGQLSHVHQDAKAES